LAACASTCTGAEPNRVSPGPRNQGVGLCLSHGPMDDEVISQQTVLLYMNNL
jgi:hypothetical protein